MKRHSAVAEQEQPRHRAQRPPALACRSTARRTAAGPRARTGRAATDGAAAVSTCGNTIAHGSVGRAAPQLAVDEVAEAARGEAERHERRDEIGDVEPALAAASARRTRARRARRGSRRGSSCRPARRQRSRADARGSRAACRTARSRAGRRGSRRTRRRTACRRRRAGASRSAGSAARGMLAQHDEQHEADEIHEPVPANGERGRAERRRGRIRDGPACGKRCGGRVKIARPIIRRPRAECATRPNAARTPNVPQESPMSFNRRSSSSRKVSPARPIARCCAPSVLATAISRSRSSASPMATAR